MGVLSVWKSTISLLQVQGDVRDKHVREDLVGEKHREWLEGASDGKWR